MHEPGRCGAARPSGERTREQRFRSTSRWQRAAASAIARDRGLCLACAHGDPARLTSERLSVHHIVPLREDWSLRLDEDNLASLCPACHERAERGDIPRAELRAWAAQAAAGPGWLAAALERL